MLCEKNCQCLTFWYNPLLIYIYLIFFMSSKSAISTLLINKFCCLLIVCMIHLLLFMQSLHLKQLKVNLKKDQQHLPIILILQLGYFIS